MSLRSMMSRVAAPLVGLSLAVASSAAAAQGDWSWPMPGKDVAGLRYSGLDQINSKSVDRLAVAWTFSLGVLRGQEAAPIVAENAMFVVTAYPNILYALDLGPARRSNGSTSPSRSRPPRASPAATP